MGRRDLFVAETMTAAFTIVTIFLALIAINFWQALGSKISPDDQPLVFVGLVFLLAIWSTCVHATLRILSSVKKAQKLDLTTIESVVALSLSIVLMVALIGLIVSVVIIGALSIWAFLTYGFAQFGQGFWFLIAVSLIFVVAYLKLGFVRSLILWIAFWAVLIALAWIL